MRTFLLFLWLGANVLASAQTQDSLQSARISNGITTYPAAAQLTTLYHLADSQLNQGLIHDPWELVRGRIPGLLISRSIHSPNYAPDVRMRGVSSLVSEVVPLVVVDGVPNVPLQTVDPNDIATLTFLSGAEALALHGAQGAGGVLVVQTKRPQHGSSLQIDYHGQAAADQIIDYWPTWDREAFLADGPRPDYGSDTDWQRALTRPGYGQAHAVSLGGGLRLRAFGIGREETFDRHRAPLVSRASPSSTVVCTWAKFSGMSGCTCKRI